MEYSSFVKSYYNYILRKLGECEDYFGKRAFLNQGYDIPKEYLFLDEKYEPNNTFMPTMSLTSDAPTECFEQFLDYYAELQPDLAPIYLGKDGLQKLYELVSKIDGDEKQFEYFALYVDTMIETLKQSDVLR